MEAITTDTGRTVINTDRCIGCGLCVSTCPVNAVELFRKSLSDQKKVPKIWDDALIKLAKGRGKLNTAGMIGMLVKSKLDRLLSR
jgi:Fe-S-cluster-containing hydrogenase component 2